MICPNINSPEWKNLVAKIGEEEAWREFLKYRTIPDADKYELIGDKVYYSIRTKSTEEIAKDLNPALIRSKNEIKFTERIIVNVLNELGELTPGVKLKVSPSQAFNNVKNIYQQAFAKFNAFRQQLLTSKEAYETLKKSDSYSQILAKFPELGLVSSYEDFIQATSNYEEIVKNFEEYKKRVIAELLRRGIKLKKNTVDNTPVEDKKNNNADQTDEGETSQQELGERFDTSAFEVNFRDTASPRVKAFVFAIEQRKRNETTGNYDYVNENGIPLYADQEDVFSDLLSAGSEMALSDYSSLQDKLSVFKAAIQKRKEARPYLQSLLDKISDLETQNRWDKINDILTFASKAYAVETLMTYKVRREGRNVVRISDVKEFGSNRDTVENQVANLWLVQHLDSGFFIKNSAGELKPDPAKVEKLGAIITEAQSLRGDDQVKKFIEYFDVLGIQITPADMVYIQKYLPSQIKRGNNTIASLFAKNGMLDQIHKSYKENLDVAFEDQYGLTNEKNNLLKFAKLYYDANPGRFIIASSRTADGKQKYLFIEPSYIENMKRRFTSAQVTSTALGAPNEEFWTGVQNGSNVFKLQYFNGIREEESALEGKVRKSLTSKEQTVTMMLKHQAQMDTGTYINFTLSDKTTTIETKMSKMFFVHTKSTPIGLGVDFTIKDGRIKPTEDLNKKIYNTFVEPEVSRILAAIKFGDQVNLENFGFASRLFYFIPSINSDPNLSEFRDDLYSGKLSLKDLQEKYADFVGATVFEEMYKSAESKVDDFIKNGIIRVNKQNQDYTFPLANNSYVTTLKSTGLKSRNLAMLMVLDMDMNYQNAQVKMIQFSKFDPYLTFKLPKQYKLPASFAEMQPADKVRIVNASWDEFSKRAAALIAPGKQGNFSWKLSDGSKYQTTNYKAVTAEDYEVTVNGIKNTTTDGQEFVTLQEHIDVLLSEGKIPFDIWESIYNKIQKAKPGGFYTLSDKELSYVFSPQKPVQVGSPFEGETTGLNRIDYVKSSRYPLIPEIEAGSERDKIRVWMEKNGISSLNFASSKKLGRPSVSVVLFDKEGNFTEPSTDDTIKATQVLERAGLRTQQEIPSQKDEIRVVSQMNRTLLDNLLQDSFELGKKSMKGAQLKKLKEDVRSRLFELESQKLKDRIGDLNLSHRGLYEAFKDVILNDTSGSYSENDLKALEIDPTTSKFKYPLEAHFKGRKLQALFNSMIEKNVMLKIEGSSFVQVSAVGSKFTFSQLGKGIKSKIIWLDTYANKFSKDKPVSLKYISKENNKVEPAQVIVSQYIRDSEGNLIDLTKYVKEKDGILILDTAALSPKIFELVATRIPNQSHPSMLPIQVVGFLPGFMENTIIVPDGITGQMGSDFDVDKLYTYFSKLEYAYKDQKEIDQFEEKIVDLQSQIADKINDRTRIIQDLTSVDRFRIDELIEEKNKLKQNLDKSQTNKRKAKKRVYYFERMSEINAELSTLFDSIGSLNILDKSNLEEIQNLKKQVRDAYEQIDNYKKPENIVSVYPVTYTEDDIENLSELSEEQLLQLYRDIHWTVLTHPSAYSKITGSIDSDSTKDKLKQRSDLLDKYKISSTKDSVLPLSFSTSISRYEDNRSGKIGVGVFANLISAQADFQDKIIRLGKYENGLPVETPIKFKYTKKSSPIDLLYVGQTGSSKSNGLTISANLNVMFSESVDNAKNLNLREFNWNQNAMSAVGFLMMLTDENNNSVPVEFAMDLTSQGAIITLFEMIEQKQDSFGEFDSKALETSVGEIQELIEKTLTNRSLIPGNKPFVEYLTDLPENNKILDSESLSESWLVHKAKGIENQQEREATLKQIAKDFGYKSADDLELKYYITQYIALDLFKELNQLGKDYQAILSGVYTYTKGIGASVFETNQKLRYLNKLSNSPRFLDTENIAGVLSVDSNTGAMVIEEPKGEIGYAVKNSLLFAQEQYKKIYPIISGPIFESIVVKLFNQLGYTSIDEVGKTKWIEYNQDIFNNLISYLYTLPELGLFDNPTATRDRLINGKTSIAYRVTEAIKDPSVANNGFLKYIDVKKRSKKGKDTYQIAMKSPFGGELDENLIRSGFFELALSDKEELRQLAKDIAIYPYLTGDAGKFGRFIPVEYLLSDSDFAKGLSKLHDSFYSTFTEPQDVDNFVQQIIQNSSQEYATNFYFSYHQGQFSFESPFRKVFKKTIGNKESLAETSEFTIRRADFDNEKTSGVFKQLSVKLSESESKRIAKELSGLELPEQISPLVLDIKYPDYIAIKDTYTNDVDQGQYKIQYLYKRTSSVIDGILMGAATYKRINVLGFGSIKEFDLGNPDLKSAIKDNNNVEDFVTPTILESSTGETAELTTSGTQLDNNNPSQYTNHSGGALGADSIWDDEGRKVGVLNHQHYYYGNKTPKGNVLLTKEQLQEGIAEMRKAAIVLGKNPQKTETVNLLARNWFQVKNSEQIVAVAPISEDMKTVEGGTGWAVAMGQANNREIHVFNQKDNNWYTWNGQMFVQSTVPVLKKNFAGIGTRQITDQGKQAIRDVYTNTFGQTQTAQPAAQSATEQADKLPPIEQNFTDGQGGRKMQPQFAGKSTMDLILSGERTRTTRAKTDVSRMIKDYGLSKIEDLVGRVIRMTDKTGRVAYTKITNVAPFTQEYQDQTWQKEGWEKSVTDKLVGDYPYAIEFELLNNTADQESQVEEDKDELVFYGGKNFIITDGQIFYTNASLEKTKPVEDPGLVQKILLTSMINKDVDKVVKINVGGKTLSYYYASPDYIYSLQDTSFGELMVGADTIKRVTEEYNKPLHEKTIPQVQVEPPITGEKPEVKSEQQETKQKFEFTYNGVSVPTEFQLTKEQSNALIKLIDFVNTGLISQDNIQNEFDNTYTLEGYAGTGKTSIIGIMDQYFKKASGSHTAFIYAAPTHAATVALGINVVKYGARLLPMTVQASVNMRYNPELGKKTSVFTKKFNDRTSIRNIFVIDESSMLDPDQVSLIIKAAHTSGVKIIFMGDPKQIPAVTPGVKQKTLSKAFANPNKVELKTVQRTKDNNILSLLTDIRNSTEYKEREFESTDKLIQVSRNEYNQMLYDDLKSDPANTVILNYTNEGVARANSWARGVLGFSGELKVGEIIVGYIGNQMKQIEKGHLANSVQYVVKDIDKRDNGEVIITAVSPKLTELKNLGITGISDGTTFTYLALEKQNKLEIPVTDQQIHKNKKLIADVLRPVHELNLSYDRKQISYPAYLRGVEEARAKLTSINIDSDYIYNPKTDTIEQYDRLRHKELKENLKLEKGIDFGYAITVHKSQGMTISNVYFDTTSLSVVGDVKVIRDGKVFNSEANAIYYVGMSRASNKLVVPKHAKAEITSSKFEDTLDVLQLLIANDKSEIAQQMTVSLFGDKKETTDYKAFLNQVYKEASPFYRQILAALGKFNALKPVTFVLDNTLDNPALYDPATATIKININKLVDQGDDIGSMKSAVYDGVMHELFHHMTVSLLTADPARLTAEQKKWVNSLKNLREFVLDKMMADPAHTAKIEAALTRLKNEGYMSETDKSIYYGLFNVEEFVSMMMSDKQFQSLLNDMTYEGDKSVWQRFLDILSSILKSIGFEVKDNSVLKEGITSVMGLIQSSTEGNLNDNPNESYASIAVDSSRVAFIKQNLNAILEEYNIQKVC